LLRRILLRAVRAAHFLSDRAAIRLLYRLQLGRWPNLDVPQLFTEKLQWLKLHDGRAIDWMCVDKIASRGLMAEAVGPDVLIPLLATFESPSEMYDGIHEIPLQPMMIKCSHGSHCGLYIRDQLADVDAIERRVARWMGRNWFWVGREWPYRDLWPRILCEQWIGDDDGNPPDDYKWMTFNGRARVLQLHRKRGGVHRIDFYDRRGIKLPWGRDGYANDGPASIPTTGFAEMIRIAERIAQGTKYLRIDLYYTGGRIYFGEITLYDSSGFGAYTRGGDAVLGELLRLDKE